MEILPTSRSKPSGQAKAQSEFEPTIIIDSREQDALKFTRLKAIGGTLTTGDYSITGLETLFAVERKSLADLVACCAAGNRERFERELHRLRGFRFRRLLIVGSESDILEGKYRSSIKPQSVIATLSAFEVRYDTPVVFCESPVKAAAQIERWVWYYSREVIKAATCLLRANGKEAVTQ